MKMKFIALAIMAGAVSGIAHAAITPGMTAADIMGSNNMAIDRLQVLDAKQTQEITDNTGAIAVNKQHIAQVEYNSNIRTQRQNEINTAIGKSITNTKALDAEQSKDISDNSNTIARVEHNSDIRTQRQNDINQAVGKTVSTIIKVDDQQSIELKSLTSDVKQSQNTGAYAQSRADAAYANTQANQQALKATNHRVAENSQQLANHEQRIQTLEASNSASFGKLKNEVDDNRQRASAAISGVAAMANIPQVIQGQTFSVGAGVGTTDSESALAVGFSARATEHVVVKASVSDDTQQNFVVGGGVSYGW